MVVFFFGELTKLDVSFIGMVIGHRFTKENGLLRNSFHCWLATKWWRFIFLFDYVIKDEPIKNNNNNNKMKERPSQSTDRNSDVFCGFGDNPIKGLNRSSCSLCFLSSSSSFSSFSSYFSSFLAVGYGRPTEIHSTWNPPNRQRRGIKKKFINK